jgi:hypothetical protein
MVKQSQKMRSPRFARDAHSPPDGFQTSMPDFQRIITEIRVLNGLGKNIQIPYGTGTEGALYSC